MFNQIPYLWCYTNGGRNLENMIQERLTRLGYAIEKGEDWFYAPGELPVLLVAHLDTVHRRLPSKKDILKVGDVLTAPWSGLGADDRAGVAGIMEILFRGYRPHVLFTDKEEVGCIGAGKAAKNLMMPDVRYIVELDRQDTDDCVFYDCDNKDFVQYVEKFGFTEDLGSYTDISKLCPAWGIAGVNLSIGYKHQHTLAEELNIAHWKNTLDRVCEMLKDVPGDTFTYVERESIWSRHDEEESYYRSKYGYKDGLNGWVKKAEARNVGVVYDAELLNQFHGIGEGEDWWQEFIDMYGDDIELEMETHLGQLIEKYYERKVAQQG